MEARKHIERLRRERLHCESEVIARALQNAMEILADNLYSTPTHFILELIQNADDNNYTTETPTISFYLGSDFLLVSGNEVGFSPSDVDAICHVGQSTKSASRDASSHIGEKGIGFKSSFKLADSIHISSRAYSFKFVKKSHPLGMITPIWEDFPTEHLQVGMTQFLFEIPSQPNVKSVTNDLRHLQPSLLIFLRRLRQINLEGELSHKKIHSVRHESRDLAGEAVSIHSDSLPSGSTLELYLVQRYEHRDMPSEPKRPGINHSEVAIAFPLTACKSPWTRDCYTYNFLPIRQYGFSFLIHADFLLTANREDVDENPDWNRGLLVGVQQGFIQAVQRFRLTNLKYSWPAYLKCLSSSIGAPLFEEFRRRLVARLKTEPILESKSGSYRRPTELLYLRPIFTDDDGEYLLRSEERQQQLLSSQYKVRELSILGVESLPFESFLSDLKNFIRDESEQFRGKPHPWHSKLASALQEGQTGLYQKLRRCRIIPLQDGSWVTPAHDNIFFASTKAGDDFIPDGIDVLLVDEAAAQCQDRRQLYQILGVKTLDIIGVCKRILETHKNARSWRVSTKDLVSHACYMFRARDRFQILPSDIFWLAGANGKYAEGKELYMELPNKVRISDFAMLDENLIPLIHPLYLQQNSNRTEAWIGWLQNTLRVAWLPRLREVGSYTTLTPEFHSLFEYILPFLDIPDPDNILWQKFSLLGVTTDLNLEYYLQYLRGIQVRSLTAADAHDIYKEMTKLLPRDIAKRKRFAEGSLIFVARPSPRWLKMEDCFWKAPPCLRSAISIFNRYPDCTRLFKDTLGLRDAATVDIVNELLALRPDNIQISHVKDLLFWLSDNACQDHGLSTELRKKLGRCAAFPVYQILHEQKTTRFATLNQHWFIADRPTLRRAFEAKVLLLDFSLNEINRLHHLFVQLELAERKLSYQVEETTEREGDYAFEKKLTDKLLQKLPFIERLLAGATDNTSMQKLKNLKVFGVTKVILKRELGEIQGESGEGDLVTSESETGFALYIKTSDLQSGDVPYSALANFLSGILEIDKERNRLLMDILVTQSHRRLDAILEQYGFHSELHQDNGPGLGNQPNTSHDDSVELSQTIEANNEISYETTEEILEAHDVASREDNSGISRSRVSVTRPVRFLDRLFEISRPITVSGKGTADNQTKSVSSELEGGPQSIGRVWDMEGLLSALPGRDANIKKTPSKSPRYSRSYMFDRAHVPPRSEAAWEDDQETGYSGELMVSLGATSLIML
ncbi:hypothetical protein N7468_006212 [Penicillium chermesinum]|uniref:Uncharacterized protein n=1 Tax=Penicillium chermesinum TaxID=63820 RepID=A0A9W9TJC7_9EURO|nr:uncharacterized protein N7468_006212 [Penicillium chermesinum]KAJ5224987.1 hypothetical protein N7468_006212 [Penicillium chermesinum]